MRAIALGLASAEAAAVWAKEPVDYVNPLIGMTLCRADIPAGLANACLVQT